MEIYALVGASGTGKSHMAMTIAIEHGIDTLIDDGLLIREGQRLAGASAKGEKTADAKKIFGVMGLGAKCGDTVTFTIEGEDEIHAAAKLEELMKEIW